MTSLAQASVQVTVSALQDSFGIEMKRQNRRLRLQSHRWACDHPCKLEFARPARLVVTDSCSMMHWHEHKDLARPLFNFFNSLEVSKYNLKNHFRDPKMIVQWVS